MMLAYVFCIVLGIVIVFMGFQAHNAGWTRVVPISYKVTYMVLYVCYVVLGMNLAINIGEHPSLAKALAISTIIAFIIADMVLIPTVVTTRLGAIKKISFKNVLRYGLEKKEEKAYRKLSSHEFAEQNNVDYISVVGGSIIENDEGVERIVARENKYIKFYPFNDGYNYSPKKEWFGKFEKDGAVYYAKIMDTKKAFKCITNLKEILMQMIQIYCDNMKNDVFIDPYEFALMLEDKPKEGYVGRAKLVITADTIKNKNVEVDEKEKMKKYYLNRLLDCFLGWNFGAVIGENTDLMVKVMLLNNWVIAKGLRERRYGTKLYFDDYIQKYKLRAKEKCF